MKPAHRLALALAIASVGTLGYVEGRVLDAEARRVRQAEVSPPQPMCMSQQRRLAATGEAYWAERDFAHAQQADGGQWDIACQYRDSF